MIINTESYSNKRLWIDLEKLGYSDFEIEHCLKLTKGTLSMFRDEDYIPPDARALLRIVISFPWILKVSLSGFTYNPIDLNPILKCVRNAKND